MKIFITFVALLIVMGAFLVYQGDMGRYGYEQELLKAVAEECAAGAALNIDEDEYALGRIVFDREKAYEYADTHMRYAIAKNSTMRRYGKLDLDLRLEFEDDSTGYSIGNPHEYPNIAVSITADCSDFFRLPFVEKRAIRRVAKYELVIESQTEIP